MASGSSKEQAEQNKTPVTSTHGERNLNWLGRHLRLDFTSSSCRESPVQFSTCIRFCLRRFQRFLFFGKNQVVIEGQFG